MDTTHKCVDCKVPLTDHNTVLCRNCWDKFHAKIGSAYWEKQSKKEKILSILIYFSSALAVIATLYAMFFS